MVSPLRRLTFLQAPKKVSKKRSPLTYGPSLRLGVPSLRHSSGGIASGLLRDDLLSMCAASPHGAARPPPDKRLHSACRGGGWIKRAEAAYRPACLSGWSTFQTVGAGLLAIAPCQSPIHYQMPQSNCGASLLAIAQCQAQRCRLNGRYRQQAGSYRGRCARTL